MIAPALRKIGTSLITLADDPSTITVDDLRHTMIQLNAQIEMIECGLAEVVA